MSEGLEKIIQEINEKAEKEKSSTISAAKKEAEKTKSEGKKKAEREKNRIMEKGKREAETLKKRILASARQDSRRKKLEAKEEIIQKTFELAEKKLAEIQEKEDYDEILIKLIEAGGKTVGGGDLKISIPKDNKEIISEAEMEEISKNIAEETGNETTIEIKADLPKSKGGAIVERKDGSISCDNTFEGRLERMKGSLRTEIAGMLFQ